MTDLHCHILPGLDDGAGSVEEALAMAAMAASQGVKNIVATPHCVTGGARKIRENVQLLRDLLREEGIPVALCAGMEIFGTYDTARLLREGRLLTINNSRYPLIEFDFHTDGEEETRILGAVLDAGYIPLVAHPERYRCICQEPEIVDHWHRMGCMLQINRGSLLGRYGNSAQQTAVDLVSRGLATVVATDAHSPVTRVPKLRDVQKLLMEEFSPEVAKTLLQENPRRILQNKSPLPVQPAWFL